MPLTKTESRILYWMVWTWDRTEEGLLLIRFYWYCAQFGTFVMMPVVFKRFGGRYAFYTLVYVFNCRYVYAERHSWVGTEEEPVSAVELITTLRREAAERYRASWHAGFSGPPQPDPYVQAPLSPLLHQRPDYWTNKPPL